MSPRPGQHGRDRLVVSWPSAVEVRCAKRRHLLAVVIDTQYGAWVAWRRPWRPRNQQLEGFLTRAGDRWVSAWRDELEFDHEGEFGHFGCRCWRWRWRSARALQGVGIQDGGVLLMRPAPTTDTRLDADDELSTLLTLEEAAIRACVSIPTVQRWIREGRLYQRPDGRVIERTLLEIERAWRRARHAVPLPGPDVPTTPTSVR